MDVITILFLMLYLQSQQSVKKVVFSRSGPLFALFVESFAH